MKRISTICLVIIIFNQAQGQVSQPFNFDINPTAPTDFVGWDNTMTGTSLKIAHAGGATGDDINFYTNSGWSGTVNSFNHLRMTILENGNIGMGQGGLFPCPTSPGWSLDVAGDINIKDRSFTHGFRIDNELILHWTPISDNLCLGLYAGLSLTINSGANTLIGTNTGRLMTGGAGLGSGGGNTFVGSGAGEYNNGQLNTFIGLSAGQSNTTGNFNSILGGWAGIGLTSGSNNVFIGDFAGQVGSTFSNNVFLGEFSARQLLYGDDNTFWGTNSGQLIHDCHDNTYGGFESALMTVGNNNTFMGIHNPLAQVLRAGLAELTCAFASLHNI